MRGFSAPLEGSCRQRRLWGGKKKSDRRSPLINQSSIFLFHIPVNIDVSGEKEVKLADLFADDGYVSTLNRMINEEMEKHSEEYKDLWAKPEIKQEHQTDFYIQDDDLVIFFQPYDLSYYARGFVEFRLDLEDLSGYMKEEYRRLID